MWANYVAAELQDRVSFTAADRRDRFNRKQHADAGKPWARGKLQTVFQAKEKLRAEALCPRVQIWAQTPWRVPLCYFWLLINSLQFSNLHDWPVFFVVFDFKLIQFELFQWKSEKFNDSWNIFQQS